MAPRRDPASPGLPAVDATERPARRDGGAFHSFRYRDFRILWYSNGLSTIANWIQQTTIGWLVFDLTGSGSILGLMNGLRSIPMFFLTPVAGVAADRMDRKRLMLSTQLVLLLGTLTVAIILLIGQLAVWHLFVFSIMVAIAMAFNQPVRQTAIFDVVPRSAVPNALALSNMGMSVTRVLGAGAGGLLLATMGASGNFFIQAAALLAATLTILMLRLPPRSAPSLHHQSPFRDMRDGFAYVGQDRRVRGLLLMGLMPPIFLWPYWNALMPIFAKEALHTGPTGLGILLAAIGGGGILGAGAVASMTGFERRGLLQLVAMLGMSGAMLGFALSPTVLIAVAFLFLGGFIEQFYMVTNQTITQLITPDHIRGRVVSLMQIPMFLFPLGSLLGGVLADVFGIRVTVITMTSIGAAIALLFLIGTPEVRKLRLSEMTAEANSAP